MLRFSFATVRAFALAGALTSGVVLAGCNKSDAAPTAVKPLALTWAPAQSHLFDLNLSTLAKLDGAPAPDPVNLKAQLELNVVVEGTTTKALLKLVHPQLVDAAGKPSNGAEAFESELAKPFGIVLSRGIITAYLEPPAQAASVAGFRRHIAAALQWGEHVPQAKWQSAEWDATGLCKVEYRAVPEQKNAWDFSKLAYERLVVSEQRAAQALDTSKVKPNIVSASGRLVTDASGIVHVERHEKMSVPLSSTASLSTDINTDLTRTGFGTKASPAAWQELSSLPRSEVGTPALSADHKLTDEARIGSHTFPEVVAKLTELEANKGGARAPASETGPLFNALVGIFRQQPETIEAAVKLARSRVPITDTLLDALAMASSDAALTSLGQLALDHDLPEPLRVRAAGSLIRAHEPTQHALELAVKLIDEPRLRETGLYGVGSFVRQLRDHGKTGLAEAGTQVLARQLKLATSPGDLATVLLAISNSGSAELYQAAVSHQKDHDASVRHAAIEAIRLMPQAAVEVRLREVLASSDRSDVLAALHALGRRPKSSRESVDRVESIAKNDPSAEIRREAALVLGLWSQQWPELVPVLADLREHDADQRVRDVAKPIAPQ